MASPFTAYTGSGDATLTDALLAPGSGIAVDAGSIVLKSSAKGAVNLYDGSLAALGIGAGLLLTSGTTPGTSNTVGWFGTDNSAATGVYNGNATIDAVVNTVFSTKSYDATTLAFDFTVADPAASSLSFDVVFGSEEFPEWVDQFVDCAVVMVNGVNYALFNHDPNHPLSVVSGNLAAGYFQDNGGKVLPIEYDGVSHALKIVAPILGGGAVNHIEIGIADTGDHIYDSGIFLANFAAGNIPGSGVVSVTPSDACTPGNDVVTGTLQDELIDLQSGDDVAYAGAGDDIVIAGAGMDSVYGGSGADQIKGEAGDDSLDGGDGSDTAVYTGSSSGYGITALGGAFSIADASGAEGTDLVKNVELLQFSDGLFTLAADGSLAPAGAPVTAPANTPGVAVVSGIGSAGKTLTASVSDADGITGPVTYQWQSSHDGGATWTDVGAGTKTYLVSAADVGGDIRVVASYLDNAASPHAEVPASAPKAILEAAGGDLVVTLMQLSAPPGASVINPLTTLVNNAIDLGLTPNMAALSVKTVLGLPSQVSLQAYDAYAVLQSQPSNAMALAVEKVAVQVAILTSLSDDDSAVKLTLKILDAASANQKIDLANANHLAGILGVDITGLTKVQYPQPLLEIFDRNSTISDAIADGGDVSVIEAEWQDLLSIQDGIASTSIADLSIHVNQAPVGSATAILPDGIQDAPYTISEADLLQGFSDVDGGSLQAALLAADVGGTFHANPDGSWTFTADAGYSGPVELAYLVLDGQGGSTAASQLFVLGHVNSAPTGNVAIAGKALQGQTLVASNTLADADGLGTIAHQWQADGVDIAGATQASFTLTQAQVGKAITVHASYIDLMGTAESVSSPATPLVGLRLKGTANGDVLNGSEGNDVINGVAGNDLLNGNGGADWVIGAAGLDTLNGGNGNDRLDGDADADVLAGGAGADRLYGGTGNDRLVGGTGSDTLVGGAGNDRLTGGGGADRFVYQSIAERTDHITDFHAGAGGDVLDVTDVLSGYLPGVSTLSNFLRLTDTSTYTLVRANVDGAGTDFVPLTMLDGVHGLLLNDLLAQGNLAVS